MEEMMIYLQEQGIYLLRVMVAAICGLLIGLERERRLKDAGVRTHLMVAMAAALMMIVSKYGFFDILEICINRGLGDAIKLDPSRVASGIVTGIGFIGTGIIFVRNQAVNGLTTAAGLWATVGIGMSLGAGMYFIGVSVTLVILLFQLVLHKNFFLFWRTSRVVNLTVENRPGIVAELQEWMKERKINIQSIKTARNDKGDLDVEVVVRLPNKMTPILFCSELQKNPEIHAVEY